MAYGVAELIDKEEELKKWVIPLLDISIQEILCDNLVESIKNLEKATKMVQEFSKNPAKWRDTIAVQTTEVQGKPEYARDIYEDMIEEGALNESEVVNKKDKNDLYDMEKIEENVKAQNDSDMVYKDKEELNKVEKKNDGTDSINKVEKDRGERDSIGKVQTKENGMGCVIAKPTTKLNTGKHDPFSCINVDIHDVNVSDCKEEIIWDEYDENYRLIQRTSNKENNQNRVYKNDNGPNQVREERNDLDMMKGKEHNLSRVNIKEKHLDKVNMINSKCKNGSNEVQKEEKTSSRVEREEKDSKWVNKDEREEGKDPDRVIKKEDNNLHKVHNMGSVIQDMVSSIDANMNDSEYLKDHRMEHVKGWKRNMDKRNLESKTVWESEIIDGYSEYGNGLTIIWCDGTKEESFCLLELLIAITTSTLDRG